MSFGDRQADQVHLEWIADALKDLVKIQRALVLEVRAVRITGTRIAELAGVSASRATPEVVRRQREILDAADAATAEVEKMGEFEPAPFRLDSLTEPLGEE